VVTDPLRAALEKKYSKRHIDRLVSTKANDQALTRRVAMLAVARDLGMNWTRFASSEEIAAVGGSRTAVTAAPPTPVPAPSAPRSRATPRSPGTRPVSAPKRRDKVFVVHGRDGDISNSMFAFLRAVGLDPIEWGEAMHKTGKGMPNIAETIDAGLVGVAAVVVVLTPDDDVILKERFHSDDDHDDEMRLSGQARPNVLFEGGLAFGRYPTRTIFVSVGKVKPFTDLGGFHITRLNDTAAKRSELVGKLRTAGADVQTDGRTQWYTTGHFEIKTEDADGK
jgi:predicted nucleotide-binding protein